MFGTREINGKWHLAIKRGRQIDGAKYPTDKDWIPFDFKSYENTLACAKELNDKYWAIFDTNKVSMEARKGMLDIIEKYTENTWITA